MHDGTTNVRHVSEMARSARLSAVGDPARRTLIKPEHPVPDRPRDEGACAPRLELFHFGMSICSQKVRTALVEAGLPFASDELVIMPPLNENYDPAYVALRTTAAAGQVPFVAGYTGATGTRKEGFDPLVVPTLVDHEQGAVVADSRVILSHVDGIAGGVLIAASGAAEVMKEVDVVDMLPHAGLFYGANPDGDRRPEPIQEGMRDVHLNKIEQIRGRLDVLPTMSPLRPAYEAKLAKEEAGRAFIQDQDKMRGIVNQTAALVTDLDARLTRRDGSWTVGDGFSLADVVWGVSLYRLLYLGYDWMWADLPNVARLAERCFDRPSIRAAVIAWPGHPPGKTIARFQV